MFAEDTYGKLTDWSPMPKLKFTQASIDEVVKPGSKSDILYWDTEASGLGLRVTPRGKATFIAQGRVAGTTTDARLTIGTYGAWTIKEARRRAQEYRHMFEDGIDPRDAKKESDVAKITLRQVADAYFARPGMLKESTRAEMDRHIEKVFEKWKNRAIASITPAECRQRYEQMATQGLRGDAPAPVQAKIAMTTLRTLINFARDEYKRRDGTAIIEHNPVSILKKDLKPTAARTGHVDEKKVGQYWHHLTEARKTPFDDNALAAIDLAMFLFLTGGRRDEGKTLTWDRVNIDDEDPSNCYWFIPDPKNKNPVWLPLSSQAVAILKSRIKPKDEDGDESPFVFASSRAKSGHVDNPREAVKRAAKAIGMTNLTNHDLRRTFVNVGVSACGLDVAKLELLTNHVPQSVTTRHYLRTSRLQYLHPEVQAIGDWIEEQAGIAAAKAAGANVVPLRA